MTNNELATIVADALSNAAQTIYDSIADEVEAPPDQGATVIATTIDDKNEIASAEVKPEVIAAAVDVVAANVVEEKRAEIDDAYKASDEAQLSYEKRLAKALEILKGGK